MIVETRSCVFRFRCPHHQRRLCTKVLFRIRRRRCKRRRYQERDKTEFLMSQKKLSAQWRRAERAMSRIACSLRPAGAFFTERKKFLEQSFAHAKKQSKTNKRRLLFDDGKCIIF